MKNIAENPNFLYHNQSQTKKRRHPNQCFKIFTIRLKRCPPTQNIDDSVLTVSGSESKMAVDAPARLRQSTRSRSSSSENSLTVSQEPKKDSKICEICQKRFVGRWPNRCYTLLRISEMKKGDTRASRFVSAMLFNEDHIYRKFVYCKTAGDIFAADIYYHSNCMILYLRKYERQIEKLLHNLHREDLEINADDDLTSLFGSLDWNHRAYELTEIRDLVNQNIAVEFDNRRTKAYLVQFYGDKVSFSYSSDRSKPQVVFMRSVEVSDIIEGKLRGNDPVKECAQKLASEIKSRSFELDESLCLAADLRLSMDRYYESRPTEWLRFVKELFANSRHKQQDAWMVKFDTIFQMFFNWLTGKMTPMHCALTQMIHNVSKSREIIDALNKYGIGMSYDSMKRIDVGIAEHLIKAAGDHRGPVSNEIKAGTPIQSAIDNFNHQERTDRGGNVSNDTVLVVWQNQDEDTEEVAVEEISKRPESKAVDRKRKLIDRLPCQNLLQSRLMKGTGEVSAEFTPITNYNHQSSLMDAAQEEHFTWVCSRNLQNLDSSNGTTPLPSQTAVKSKLLAAKQRKPRKTAKSFYPILGYPATEMDSIYTSMVNFKDILSQRGETNGVIWCDEGVYCIAKEIQMLKPDEFGMLFIGMGPFHWSKIVMGAIGKWLSQSGIGDALTNSRVFAPGVAKSSVLQGSDYVKAKNGLNIIAEAITILQLKAFFKSEDFEQKKDILGLDELKYDMDKVLAMLYESTEDDEFQCLWESTTISLRSLHSAFKEFRQSQNADENFAYWNLFLDYLYPCFRDFESSVRSGNWKLFLSSVERSIVIFFAMARPNYSRYGPLFLQDCFDIQRRFPDLHKHFERGNFVCHMSSRYGSAIGFDQGLEKAYNHPSKAFSGIIGMTRRKEAVAMWDILKHDKDLCRSFVMDTVMSKETLTELDSLHYEFNETKAKECHGRVQQLVSYIESVKNPFLNQTSNLTNLTTLETVENADYLLNCIDHGKQNYESFIDERLDTKVKGLHEKISFKYIPSVPEHRLIEKVKPVKLTSDDQENNSAVSFIQYATSRGRDIETLLTYPITTRPVYLLKTDSVTQKKADKADITNSLLKLLDKDTIIVSSEEEQVPYKETTACVVDFMSVIRRFSAVKMKDVTTFGEFCKMILGAIQSYGRESEEMHLILENYCDLSIKSLERASRGSKTKVKGVVTAAPLLCEVTSEQQILPHCFDDFFRRTSNKISLQNFFVAYCVKHYSLVKPLFIAGGSRVDPEKCLKIFGGSCEEAKIFRASHEEADDRLMYSINKIYQRHSGQCSVTVVSPDADIFVTLLYHLNNTWIGMTLYLMKKGKIKDHRVKQNELYPLHFLLGKLGVPFIDSLPAGHALTGCDSSAKVGTKASLFKILKTDAHLIKDFGVDVLDDEGLVQAETFLVKVIAAKDYQKCLSFDEIRAEMHRHTRDKKFIELPCTSNEIQQHIRRAYYQTRMWLESAFGDARELMRIEDYGYESDYTPKWFIPPHRPSNIPEPCNNCTSCVRRTCPCRQQEVSCSSYCKCGDRCKNPLNLLT